MIGIFTPLILALLSFSSHAEESNWDVATLWKGDRTLFTERGSRHFESDGPMLRSIRVSKRVLKSGERCNDAIAKIRSHPIGEVFSFANPDRFRGWDGWEDDIDSVEKCDSFPCKIKFNESETLAVAAKSKDERLKEALNQVENRVRTYEKSSRRGGYDLVADPVDPWKMFVALGNEIPAAIKKMKPSFFARKLRFGEGSYKPLRQIFDERTFEERGRIVRIARDVYTSHYFDGWGEWLEARCSANGQVLFILQDLVMEFDLLKNSDLFSRIARPKMRQGVEQESLKYQKAQAERFAR